MHDDPTGHESAVHEYPFPIRIPPLGFSAVPSPKKNRHTSPNANPDGPPTAEATGTTTPGTEAPAAEPSNTEPGESDPPAAAAAP
ncbi:MAG TPA: hypothetical protein PLD01_05565 [Mycobacterium sp.]|nr:hypothetical protein [Mycobacterium sp.]